MHLNTIVSTDILHRNPMISLFEKFKRDKSRIPGYHNTLVSAPFKSPRLRAFSGKRENWFRFSQDHMEGSTRIKTDRLGDLTKANDAFLHPIKRNLTVSKP